jgi:hypothetical protein
MPDQLESSVQKATDIGAIGLIFATITGAAAVGVDLSDRLQIGDDLRDLRVAHR